VKDHARLWFRGKIKNIRDFVVLFLCEAGPR